MFQPMQSAFRDYSAENTLYSDHNVYSAKSNEQWSALKDESAVKCDTCSKKCHDAFMRVYYSGINTHNFCSPKCWGTININKN